jgi:hypothetical protein
MMSNTLIHRKPIVTKRATVKKGGKRKSKRSGKYRKTRRNKKQQKGGISTPKKGGSFVSFRNILNDKCTICQDDLQSSEMIIEKGIIYELACGHQFHNNCLNGWCAINSKKAKSDYEKYQGLEEYLRPPANFKCPVCNQTTINEENDCITMDAYENDYLGDKKNYTTEEYTGIKPKKRGFARFFK